MQLLHKMLTNFFIINTYKPQRDHELVVKSYLDTPYSQEDN
jgi:hypothetical protein